MPRSVTVACISVLFATNVWAADPSPMNQTNHADPPRVFAPVSTEPEAATLQIGAPAPMFSYMGPDGRWYRSEELLTLGSVVVIFAPTDEDLVGLKRTREALDQIGVRTIPVLDLPTRKTTSLARRLAIEGTLVSDPMSAIAGLYHAVDRTSGTHVTSYFVVDGKRCLRAMYYGPLPSPETLLATAARSLGRPLPSSVFSTTDDR